MIDSKSKHINDDGIPITIPRPALYALTMQGTIPDIGPSYYGKAIVSRFKSSYSDYSTANRRLMNLLLESNLVTGEIVTAGSDSYLTLVSKKEVVSGQEISIIAHGMLCNTTLTVTRTEITYDEYGNPTGETTTTVINAAPCRTDQVTARMRQEDPGLLPGTLLKVYATVFTGLVLLDKAIVAGNSYRVDDINLLEFPGAMVLQLSAWTG